MPAEKVRLVVFDVDGVLTDGGVFLDGEGREPWKRFSVKDGLGIQLLRRVGLHVGIVSGRASGPLEARLRELDVKLVVQGTDDKVASIRELWLKAGVREDEVAYMGDDLPDLPALRRVGFPIAPADAVPEVRAVCELVTKARGGDGAVREAAEAILRAQERWAGLVEGYLA